MCAKRTRRATACTSTTWSACPTADSSCLAASSPPAFTRCFFLPRALIPAANCDHQPASAEPYRSTRTTTRTTEATAPFTPVASARTAPTAAATTTRRFVLAHPLLAPFPPLTRILLSQPMLCADYLAGFCPKGPGQLHVCTVSQQQCAFRMPVCNVAALQHAPRAIPRSTCQRLGLVWAGMRALDIRQAAAPRFIVIDMEAYVCAVSPQRARLRHSGGECASTLGYCACTVAFIVNISDHFEPIVLRIFLSGRTRGQCGRQGRFTR